MRVPVVHHPAYVAPLPPAHRFPMPKFARLLACLRETGLLLPSQEFVPEPAPRGWLELAHAGSYVTAILEGRLEPAAERRLGLPLSPALAMRARCAVAGTVLAARLALEHGVACNTAGGSHHAFAGFGSGFCVFNDVAVAAALLLAEGLVGRVLVFDLDVHQGDGTAAIFAGDPSVFTLSLHGRGNFPFRKCASDLDVELADGTDDARYLAALHAALPHALGRAAPDLAIYLAGADPYAGDRLGRLALSKAGLAARDRCVLATLRDAGVPVAIAMAGGYADAIDDIVDIHAATVTIAWERWRREGADACPGKPRVRARVAC